MSLLHKSMGFYGAEAVLKIGGACVKIVIAYTSCRFALQELFVDQVSSIKLK